MRLFLASLVGLMVLMIAVLVLVMGRTASFAAESATREWKISADAAADLFNTAEGASAASSLVESRLIYIRDRYDIGAIEFQPKAGQTIASGDASGLTPIARRVAGGTLTCYFDERTLQSTRRVFLLIGTICVAASLAGAILLMLYLPKITRPIELLLDHAGEIAERGANEDEAKYLVDTFRNSVAVLKKQEEELRHLHALQKSRADDLERVTAALTRSLTSGFVAIDSDGKIVDANAPAREIISGGRETVQGLTIRETFGETDFSRLLEDAFRRRAALSRVEAATLVDGERRTIGLTTVPLVTEEQQFLGILALFTDLTQIRGLEARVRELQTLADLGEIAAGIAHEFRNSLSTILGYLRLSRHAATPAQGLDAIEKAEREATTLSSAVDGLLSFARPMKIVAKPVDLLDVAQNVAERLSIASGIEVQCEGEAVSIQADRPLLDRAVENVVRNAVDSVRRKADGGRVSVRVTANPHPALIVEDNGVGVAPADVPALFLPFRSDNPEGLGLGLPLARKIVLLHGGTVRLTGEPGRGATATIEFAGEIPQIVQRPRMM